jgi:hypothetical protein
MSIAVDIRQRLTDWLANPRVRSQWRRESLVAMHEAVTMYLKANSGPLDITHSPKILSAVDRAYPFGQRKYTPYKCWLSERKRLRFVLLLLHESQLEQPNEDDFAACEVAIDLVEEDNEGAARKLLDEQAPRRLNRSCPSCGAAVGAGCYAAPDDKWTDAQGAIRIVPHLSRVLPSRVNGPLFGGAP